ncbi:aminoglycoside phosphotransferase family protein [Oligoflexia bacterium]|nr:aminoglycoside phosphotransferase family protein [Oligoflexia bacterium]
MRQPVPAEGVQPSSGIDGVGLDISLIPDRRPEEPQADPSLPEDKNERFNTIMQGFLSQQLPQLLPETFSATPHVASFPSSGATARGFKVTTADGQSYYAKLRPLSDEELAAQDKLLDISPLTKEATFTKKLKGQGIKVADITPPVVLGINELPGSIDGLDLRFGGLAVKGRERPYLLMLQSFEPGEPARVAFDNQAIQQKATFELGQQIRTVNEIEVDGFGSNYDATQNRFTQNWSEFLEELGPERKAKELQQLGIFTDQDVERIKAITAPLKQLNPQAVLTHTDLNLGNYLTDAIGGLSCIVDWETAKGAPWQYEIATALNSIEATNIGVPFKDRAAQAQAFIDGYGISGKALADNTTVIDALRVTDAVSYMHALHITYGWKHEVGAYQTIANETFQRTKAPETPDYRQSLLGVEAILRNRIGM